VDPVVKNPQQETKYLKQALWWNYDTQKEILMHPLVQLFVFRKFQKLRAIIYGWIFWQVGFPLEAQKLKYITPYLAILLI